MANYFNFTKITPAAPNDPLVDEAAQLNANWDHVDTKLQPYMTGVPTPTQAGQEYFDGSFRYVVWDGAAPRIPDEIDVNWSAWTALPMLAPRVIRPSFTPRWRNNSLLRMVELAGGVQFDAAANPWTMGGTFTLNGDVSGSPPASMLPIGGVHKSQAATALSAGTTVVAGAAITVDKPGGNTFLRIFAQYMGGPGGGNFIELDQVWWWY